MSARELERLLQEEPDEETIDKAIQEYLQSPGEVIPMPGKYTAQEKYDAKNTKQVKLKLNLTTDADILARFEQVGNVQGYIKRLIREDISRG